MRTQRINAARKVAGHLYAAERAIDIAATRVAELSAAMPMARLDANLSAMIGQDAFASSADALALIAKVREHIVVTHERLRTAGDQIGLEAISFGDAVKPNAGHDTSTPAGRLRIAS